MTATSNPAAVAEALRAGREQIGMSLRDVEAGTGIANSYVGEAERGQKIPSVERLLTLADFYGIPAKQLLEDAGYPKTAALAQELGIGTGNGGNPNGPLGELNRVGLLAALSDGGVLTPVSFKPDRIFVNLDLDAEETLNTWEAIGRFFGRVHRSAKWWIGDWLNFGEGAFGERYAQAADATGLSIETLQNVASIARKIPPSRRREAVSFSTHGEVAPLTPDEQAEWLEIAEVEGLSQRELRQRIRAVPPAQQRIEADEPPRRTVNPTQVVSTAQRVAATAQREGDHYLVPVEAFAQLLAALGEDEA